MSYSPDIKEITPTEADWLWKDARDAVDQIGPEAFLTEAGINRTTQVAAELAKTLPSQVKDTGFDFQENGIPNGAVVFRSLRPPEELTHVIPDEFLPEDPWSQAAGLLAVTFTTAFGPPIQFSTHPSGVKKFVTSISPRPGLEDSMTVSMTADTGWHTEVGSSPWRPATIQLLGIRSDERAAVNSLIPAQRIINALDPETVEILKQARYIISDTLVPGSDTDPRPVITRNRRGEALTFTHRPNHPATAKRPPEIKLLDDSDKPAEKALAKVRFLLDKEGIALATSHIILAGDVFAKDHNGLHSRGL
ncbi:MAG TPA: hypothetical protein VNZ45_11970, partial [Bacteroidia bacterium]|nr:hypothetical protein [Bacteroidia bacterium]